MSNYCMDDCYSVEALCYIFQGQAHNLPLGVLVKSFAIDSRKIEKDDFFFCIIGEKTDGHQYIKEVLEKQASFVVADLKRIPPALLSEPIPLIAVEDPNKALRDLATYYRQQYAGCVIGVTGSNGKTSTKEIIAGLCRYLAPDTHATAGNFNNYIGLPLTLLSAPLRAQWWVVEMGTNHFGEIATLSQIAQPHLAIITNIGESHLEYLENTEGVAREKSGIFEGMPPHSSVVIPCSLKHQELVKTYAQKSQIKLITYGFKQESDLHPPDYLAILEKSNAHEAEFQFLGVQFHTQIGNMLLLKNLLGAITLLHEYGISVGALQEAVAALQVEVKGRIQIEKVKDWILVDDSYNANPTSFQNVLHSLRVSYPKQRIVILAGRMAELGIHSHRLHHETGKFFAQCAPSLLLAFGDNDSRCYVEGWREVNPRENEAHHFVDKEKLIHTWKQIRRPEDIVLVKGSRSAQMDHFVDKLRE
ncbi:UDP-N-acetylmuramoyl-tripeptide--D-alanyl-D-alanine ligase [Deltaproteobacteria bacterium TL4]